MMYTRTCAIVGAGPGISLAVARRFAREGFKIALLARRGDALETVVDELKKQKYNATGFVADAGDKDSLVDAFAAIRETLGAPSVLVYNAAVLRQRDPTQLDAETLIDDFQVNVAGALVCVQQVVPQMRKQKHGTILFTGGGLALNPLAHYASLAMGKSALRSLAATLAQELEPDHIRVGTVTINGFVQPGTHFDPTRIAEAYWTMHMRKPSASDYEFVYQ